MMQVNIVAKEPLAHGFVAITFEAPFLSFAQPGQGVITENNIVCSLYDVEKNRASCILPPEDSPFFEKNTLMVSSLQGEIIPPPLPTSFYLLTGNVSILGSLLFYLKKYRKTFQGLVFLEGKKDFPFFPCPSRYMISHIPNDVIATIPLLEDWGVPNRLTTLEAQPGCYHGSAEALAALWLSQVGPDFMRSCVHAKIPPIKL